MTKITEQDNLRQVSISAELYSQLRKFCDKTGISFSDFAEDALEGATRRYELEELLNNQAKVKEKVKTEREKAYLEGFARGVIVTFLALEGKTGLSEQLTPTSVKEQPRYQVVSGKQLKLF